MNKNDDASMARRRRWAEMLRDRAEILEFEAERWEPDQHRTIQMFEVADLRECADFLDDKSAQDR
jgi:hypothetical protein